MSRFPFLLILFLFQASCTSIPDPSPPALDAEILAFQEKFVPDRRVARFDVDGMIKEDGILYLTGETTMPRVLDSLVEVLSAERYELKNEVLSMPAAELGADTFALARHSVVNLRSEKGHSQELATQVLLGTPLRVLKQDEEWFFVQCPDGYLAWVHGGEIVRMDAAELSAWKQADRLVFTPNAGHAYTEANITSRQVADLVAGDLLVRQADLGRFTTVAFPDARTAYVPTAHLQPFSAWLAERKLNFALSKEIAFQQIGKPYFWGGTSPKAMDCSGFTKTVYWQQGLIIPRDASQQVHAGEPVNYDEELNGLQPGDLLFFGRYREDGSEKITHVGLYLGAGAFIHSGSDNGANRVQNLLPDHPDYVAHRRESLMRARRLGIGTPFVQSVADHPWYW